MSRILLTGANGYIGQRLLPALIDLGHTVICCVRDKNRYNPAESLLPYIEIIEVDFLKPETLTNIPDNIQGAYYLMHSMSSSVDYEALERSAAMNFRAMANAKGIGHVIYLSGIVNEHSLSKHLGSRKAVERILGQGEFNLTTLRAGIIIGSGSASFEIIRDLVEKLPVMIVPKWLRTKSQPIGVRDVIAFLAQTLLNPDTLNKSFDIGGPDVLSYKEMLLIFAKVRNLKRSIFVVPVMTPRLSSYWLYFVTSTSFKLAMALVDSMKVEVVCRNNHLNGILGIEPAGYEEALERTLAKVVADDIVSSWKDSLVSGRFKFNLSEFLNVPTYGCFVDQRKRKLIDRTQSIQNIWRIGGNTGWYYATWLWKVRGFMDQLVGGVGLRRGRRQDENLQSGDAVDFWRVLYANKEEGRLLLFAEMKLPGEAWLEFRIKGEMLYQTATFRPRGVLGRLYWYAVLPFHAFIFNGLLKVIIHKNSEQFEEL